MDFLLFVARVETIGPVNVFPKTSSSGGRRVLGVVVLVMERRDGSMSCSFDNRPASVCLLYCLTILDELLSRRYLIAPNGIRCHCIRPMSSSNL